MEFKEDEIEQGMAIHCQSEEELRVLLNQLRSNGYTCRYDTGAMNLQGRSGAEKSETAYIVMLGKKNIRFRLEIQAG